MRTLIFVVLCSILCVTPCAAESVAGWEIGHYPTSGKSEGCFMAADYKDGTTFGIYVTEQHAWGIILINKTWTLKVDDTTDVAAFVDGKMVAGGKAKHTKADMAILPLEGNEVYSAMKNGSRLDLRTPFGTLNFALTGTRRAMDAVISCVDRVRQANASGTPSESATPSQSADTVWVTGPQLVDLLSKIFNDANIQGYQTDTSKSGNGIMTFSLADGTRGIFRASRNPNSMSAEEFASSILGTLSEVCEQGEFLSGKKTVPTEDGSVVRKLVATCRKNNRSVTTETTIVRRASGFLMELTQTLPGDTQGESSGNYEERSALTDAAMRYSGY